MSNAWDLTTSGALTRFNSNVNTKSTYGPSTASIGPNSLSASGYVDPTIVTASLVEPSQYTSPADNVAKKSYPGFEIDGVNYI